MTDIINKETAEQLKKYVEGVEAYEAEAKEISERKKESGDNFVPDIQDYSSISDDKANFIYENCKEYLIHTVNNRQDLQKKVVLLLSFIFIFSLTSFLFIKSIDIADTANYPNFSSVRIVKFIEAMIACNLSTALILTFFGFYPKNQAVSGNEPINLLKQDFVNQEIRFMKVGEIIRYQESIDINSKSNWIVALTLKISITLLVACPIVLYLFVFGLRAFI